MNLSGLPYGNEICNDFLCNQRIRDSEIRGRLEHLNQSFYKAKIESFNYFINGDTENGDLSTRVSNYFKEVRIHLEREIEGRIDAIRQTLAEQEVKDAQLLTTLEFGETGRICAKSWKEGCQERIELLCNSFLFPHVPGSIRLRGVTPLEESPTNLTSPKNLIAEKSRAVMRKNLSQLLAGLNASMIREEERQQAKWDYIGNFSGEFVEEILNILGDFSLTRE